MAWPPFWRLRCESLFFEWKLLYFIQITHNFVPREAVDNTVNSTLVQMINWCRTDDKLLPEPIMTLFIKEYMFQSASMANTLIRPTEEYFKHVTLSVGHYSGVLAGTLSLLTHPHPHQTILTLVKLPRLIWRSANRRFHLRVIGHQISCSDLTSGQSTMMVVTVTTTNGGIPFQAIKPRACVPSMLCCFWTSPFKKIAHPFPYFCSNSSIVSWPVSSEMSITATWN